MAAPVRPPNASAFPCITFASASYDMRPLARQLHAARPDWRITVWPDAGWQQSEVAVCWNTPAGLYSQMPALKLVHGIAAGVDNIAADTPAGVPLCRIVDAQQVQGMVEFVLWSVLYFHRAFDRVIAQHRQAVWARPVLRPAQDFRVGVAGLGAMGTAVARALVAQGYGVSGFSRKPREIDGVDCHAGPEHFAEFLSTLNLLVCTLPLTPDTEGILSQPTFAALPTGAALVHVGRGAHLRTNDLTEALVSGQISGAIVDVFPDEPLAADDPLWAIPGLLVTPHMATLASTQAIVEQIALNVERLGVEADLSNVVASVTTSRSENWNLATPRESVGNSA